MKACKNPKCMETKPLTEFPKNSNMKDGRGSWCKACVAEYQREWRKRNPEKTKEASRKWEAANRERRNEYQRQYYHKRKNGGAE